MCERFQRMRLSFGGASSLALSDCNPPIILSTYHLWVIFIMGNSWKNFDLTFSTLRAFRQRDSSLSLSLITQSGLNSRITIIIRTLGSLQNRVALMHWPKFSEILSAGETQFIGTAGDVCFLENLNHNSGLHFHLLSQVSELTSYEFVSSTGCTSTAPTDPLNVPVAQMGWGIRDAAVVCLAASMSYQNLAYNINLLSGGWHFKATHS